MQWLREAWHGPASMDATLLRDVLHRGFGLQLRESDDGDVWVDVQPLVKPETLH